MRDMLYFISSAMWVIQWAAGIVLAKGVWSTLAAVFTGGFWSLYLVIEKTMQISGII